MKYLTSILLIITLIFSNCRKSSNCPRYFQIPAYLTPVKEEYTIGDTITVTSKFQRNVYEKQTDKKFDMKGIKWNPLMNIYKIDTEVEVNYTIKDNFEFIPNDIYDLQWFIYSDGGSSLTCEFNYQQDTFAIELKIIPKTTGLYFLAFGSGLINSNQDFPGKCTFTDFEVHTKMNNGEDNNIYLLEESPDSHYNDWVLQKPDKRFHKGGGYVFRVVE